MLSISSVRFLSLFPFSSFSVYPAIDHHPPARERKSGQIMPINGVNRDRFQLVAQLKLMATDLATLYSRQTLGPIAIKAKHP